MDKIEANKEKEVNQHKGEIFLTYDMPGTLVSKNSRKCHLNCVLPKEMHDCITVISNNQQLLLHKRVLQQVY